MAYSVKQLATLSGVSARTLRFYDEIDLLKPAYHSDKGYRYYEEEQLLLLQQILFFRDLGFKLNAIKSILDSSDFDKLNTLRSHRSVLKNNLSKTQALLTTIDKTIAHLEGETKMTEEELYIGFKHPKQLEMADYMLEKMGAPAQRLIDESKEKIKQLSPEDFRKLKSESLKMKQQFKAIFEKKLSPDSDTVQAIIHDYYYQRVLPFSTPTGEELIELIKIEQSHPEYADRYNDIHPKFAEFFLDAVKFFVKENL